MIQSPSNHQFPRRGELHTLYTTLEGTKIMTNTHKNRVKILLRQVFWQLDDCSDRELTPILIRQFLANNVPHTLLEPFAINITGGDWWERIEKLVWMFIEAKKHA